jgi:hypothetical protein
MEKRNAAHDRIARWAKTCGAEDVRLNNSVSVVDFGRKKSLSLEQLSELLKTCDDKRRALFGSIGGNLIVSFNYQTQTNGQGKKKRGREETEPVDEALARVKKKSDLSEEHVAVARAAVVALTGVRGVGGENAVQSWGLHTSNGESSRPRLILSARLTPGIAVGIYDLKTALGNISDGLITLQEPSAVFAGFNLPLTEATRTASALGATPVTLLATVARPRPPAPAPAPA